MQFCKIKLLAFICCFVCSVAGAQVVIGDMPSVDVSAYGSQKTLGFSCWGHKMPFDVLTQIVGDLGKQRHSYELAKMTAKIISQKTWIDCKDFDDVQAQKWLILRLQTLLNLGFADEVIALVKTLPALYLTPEVLQLKADAYLIQDDLDKACVVAAQNTLKTDYFTKMNIMCLALKGKTEQANLAFDMWQERQTKADVFSNAMGTFFDLPTETMAAQELSVLDAYLLNALHLPYDKNALPLPLVKFEKKYAGRFARAVNIDKLLSRWQQVDEKEQQYRLYLLTIYRDLFRPDLKFIRTQSLWHKASTSQKYDTKAMMLQSDANENISGSDLLLSLWLLSERIMPVETALVLLNRAGLNVESFIVEGLD